MDKVLIVDDEYLVADGLNQFIDWQAFGLEVGGIAYDGERALALIRDLRPALVFTDIRMPGMSGLELIRRAQAISPDTTFIIISGYNDFEYIRSAIRLRVFDYLGKPVTVESVSEVLTRFRAQRAKRMKDNASPDQVKHCVLEVARRALLGEAIPSFPDGAPSFSVLLCAAARHADGEVSLEALEATAERFAAQTLLVQAEDVSIAIAFREGQSDDARGIKAITAAMGALSNQSAVKNVGIGEPASHLDDLPRAIQSARVALDYAIFFDDPWIDALRVAPSGTLPGELPQAQRLFFQMRLGEKEAVLSLVRERMRAMTRMNISIELFRHETLELAYQGLRVVKESGAAYARLPHAEMGSLRTAREIEAWVIDLFSDMLVHIERQNQVVGKKNVDRARQYIDEHYGEAITLEQLSEMCDMHPTYFSIQFKAQVGENYVKYISKVRMERAGEMLRRGMPVKRVAQHTGFTSQRYFTDRFKAFWGMTPSQYRDNTEGGYGDEDPI